MNGLYHNIKFSLLIYSGSCLHREKILDCWNQYFVSNANTNGSSSRYSGVLCQPSYVLQFWNSKTAKFEILYV